MKKSGVGEQITMFDLGMDVGKMCQVPSVAETPRARTSGLSSRNSSALVTAPYLCLDLRTGAGNLLGPCWERDAPWLGECTTLNTGPAPHSGAAGYTLSQILQDSPPTKYYLSSTACLGILRRAKKRGKSLPPVLKAALELQSTIDSSDCIVPDTDGREVISFACNQRDEVRDLHDVAGAVQAQPGMKQQTFVLNPWDTQQARISVPEGVSPALCGADGGGGRNPAGLIMAAGFCAGAGSKAQGIGYQEEISPTLKSGGGNGMPSILCVNDQGGQVMSVSENVSGALRAQEHGHQPLVLASQQGGAEIGVDICPTITAAAGMSGNNQPIVTQPETYCIMGNAINRQPHNGGNGIGVQPDMCYTLTATDRHSVFTRQRVDVFQEGEVASTQSARQYKDATDLIYQKTVGTLVASDKNGPNNQYVGDDKCIVMPTNLIRRLTPLECERLQGFPDFWTDILGASDSARYKALGNSVAIPCVSHVLRGVSYFLTQGGDADA